MNAAPLNDDELDYLDELLQGLGSDHSILDVNELDGFITAMVVSPDHIPMERWYPQIWGGAQYVPELDSEEEAEQLEHLLIRMEASLREQLEKAPENFSALFYEGEFHGEVVTVVEEWCFGFMRGVRFAGWPELPEKQGDALAAIALHGEEENFPTLNKLSIEEHQQSVALIEPAVCELYAWFHQD